MSEKKAEVNADVNWALGWLSEISWMPGFPQGENQARLTIALARQWLLIVGPQPSNTFEVDGGPEGDGPRMVTVEGKTRDETAAALVSEIMGTRISFPLPVQMRQIYERLGFVPADKRRAIEMEG